MKKGFTLIELLVVFAIIGLLMGILLPVLTRARLQAKILATNMDLRQIGLALDCYCFDNKKYPPTQADCATGSITDHLYQLPKVLVTGHYLPSIPKGNAMSTVMEDRFNPGHTYKYRSIGEVIKDRNNIEKYIFAKLWIPDNFPASSSINPNKNLWRPTPEEIEPYKTDNNTYNNISMLPMRLPVSWAVFSLGPKFSRKWLEEKLGGKDCDRYPVPKELWYTPKEHVGFLVRLKLQNSQDIGTFQKN
jgi:type II secretion system protein G